MPPGYLKTCLLLAALCLGPISPEAAAEPDIDREKNRLIRELLEVTGAEANRDALTRTFSQQLISVLQANKTNLTPRAIEIISEEVGAVVDEQLATKKLQDRMLQIYARYFTIEEIEGLIAFNRSPIGKKANRVMPILMQESMSAAQSWSEEIGPALSKRVTARLGREGIKIGQ